MEITEKFQIEKRMGEPGCVNKNSWLVKTLNYPPAERCQYCELKFRNCLFFQYLIISLILIFFILTLSFLIEGNISKLLIISISEWAIIEPVIRAHCDLIQANRVEAMDSLGGERFGLSVSEATMGFTEAKREMESKTFVEEPFFISFGG